MAAGRLKRGSRLSGDFAGLLIAFPLQRGGVTGGFVFIALAMLVVMLCIGLFGPRTRGRSLEDVSS